MSDPENNNNLPRFFSEDRKDSDKQRRGGMGRWAVVALTLTVMALGTVIWLGTAGSDPEGAVPTITAAAGDYKKRPENPGGRKIAHRESTVFRTLQGDDASGGASKPRIENLTQTGEGDAPLPADRFYADLDSGLGELTGREASQASEDTGNTGVETNTEQKAAQLASRNEPGSEDDEDTLDFVRDVLEKKDEIEGKQDRQQNAPGSDIGEKKPQVMPQSRDDNTGSGATDKTPEQDRGEAQEDSGYYVQLGSFRKQDIAERAWQRARENYKGALDGVSRDIQRVELDERGTYYRARGGPVTQARANEICRAIKKKDENGCLVVRPGE